MVGVISHERRLYGEPHRLQELNIEHPLLVNRQGRDELASAAKGPLLCAMTDIRVKRIYEPPARSDGKRILVDRIWPRGLTREDARIDAWIKEVAPSNMLRRWFGHDPEKWQEFRARYVAELRQNPAVAELRTATARSKSVTLLFAARDCLRNNAIVLREFLCAGGLEP
jgi:uncharacterized protein YeaO (DUF488 family)